MRHRTTWISAGLFLTIVAILAGQLTAQTPPKKVGKAKDDAIPDSNNSDHDPSSEIQIWGGYGYNSKTPIGRGIDGSKMGVLAIRYSHRWDMNRLVALKFIYDFTPMHILSFPQQKQVSNGDGTFRTETVRRTVYGIGTSVGGVQLNFLRKKKVQPFISLNTGIMYFSKPVPNDEGAKLNFTAEIGTGVDVRLSRERNMHIGYKFYHVSNFYSGDVNPGFNTNMIFVGYSLKKW